MKAHLYALPVTTPAPEEDLVRVRLVAGLLDELQDATAPASHTERAFCQDETEDWLADTSDQAAALARHELHALYARIGGQVGPFRLTALLGRGGMGAVFAAERSDGAYAQRVALKLIRAGSDAARMASRFRRERAILARLEHVHIARLLEGGVSAAGEPWFAMELVEGTSLAEYCESKALSVRACIELFLQICDAVAYAHRNLIVHRDLKPANVLVDQNGQIKLLDFGIAKLIDVSRTDTQLTLANERVLTPDYAAPEQILGQPITTTTDIYALGLLLFEMLSGQRAQRLAGKSALEAERWVVNQEIVRPSCVPGPHARALRGDLDAIVGKALRKEPERRYGSAQVLAEDLHNYLAGHPVRARGDAWTYRAGSLVRRHRWLLTATASVVIALALGLSAALWQAREAQVQAQRAQHVRSFVIELFRGVDPRIAGNTGRELSAVDVLDTGLARLHTQLAEQPADKAELLLALADLYRALGRFKEAMALSAEALALQHTLWGEHDLRLLPALTRIARDAVIMHRLAESAMFAAQAEQLLLRADEKYDPERLRTLQTRQVLANRQGDDPATERIAEQILALQQRRFGMRAAETSVGLAALGWAYGWANRYDEAEAMYRRALALPRVSGHGDFSDFLGFGAPEDLYKRLGELASFRGQHREARAHFQRGLAISTQEFGAGATISLQLRRFIILEDSQLGRAREAEGELRALSQGSASDNSALIFLGLGKLEAARPLLAAQFESARANFGVDAKLSQFAARDFAALLTELGALDEAEPLLKRAMAQLARLETPASHQYAKVEARYARLLLARGDAEQAEQHARHAYGVLRTFLGPNIDETAFAQHELGRALRALGKPEEGLPLLREAAASYAAQFGVNDLRTAAFRFELGEALLTQDAAAARKMLDASARVLTEAPGNMLPVRARAERWLAARNGKSR